MAAGFRKSLFGFNCEDVIAYVKKMHDSFSEKEIELKSEIGNLNQKIDEYNSEHERLLLEKAEIEKTLAEYNAKSAEIERLSENIGKLYLVAQTNARAIMNNAEENSKIANDEISKNLDTISDTHLALRELRESIATTSANFSKEIEVLMQSLSVTKSKIVKDNKTDEQAKADFSVVMETLSR